MKVCLNCNKELDGNKKKFCCKKCDDVWKYNNNRSKTTCEHCGKEFDYPSKKVLSKPKYCSRVCASEGGKKKRAGNKQCSPSVHPSSNNSLPGSFLSQCNPIVKGAISESLSYVYMISQGWEVYNPATQEGRTDFLAIIDSNTFKVQVKTVRKDSNGKFTIGLHKNSSRGEILYNKSELDFVLAYSPYHNSIIKILGKEVWDKRSITFSSKAEGNYCGTSRFIEDYIVYSFNK